MIMEVLASDSAGKDDVLFHHGDAVGMDGAKVGILEKTGQVALCSFLKSEEGS